MGGVCCSGEEKKNKDMNLSIKGQDYLKQLPLFAVIKTQAAIRGFIARRRVKRIYGYQMSPGLLNRGTVHVEMDPDKLDEQRYRV